MTRQRIALIRQGFGLLALAITAVLATAGLAADAPSTTSAQVAHEVATWPIHVALSAVAIAAVWMALHFGQKKDELAFERDKMNAEAMGRLTDAMIALRDVEAQRQQELARLSAAIEHRPCLCGTTHTSTQSHRKGRDHEQPESTL